MQTITYENLLSYLTHMANCDAFELCFYTTSEGTSDCYIPYMMSDAMEYYLVLKNCRIKGTYLPESKSDVTVETIKVVDSSEISAAYALLIRQGEENVFTLWFDEIYEDMKLYQYHEIGHFWVEGEEHWRQLVYIIGTIHDKYAYLGEDICTDAELALLPLMEFAPFRYYSPIHESLDEWYEDSLDGAECMKELAVEVNDHWFAFLVSVYKKFPFVKFSHYLAKVMNKPKRQKLYELIYRKMCAASLEYDKRDYGYALNEKIRIAREHVRAQLISEGFQGKYPEFKNGNVQILVTEEHPFTIMDYKDFEFKIQLMVSETKRKNAGLNAGFFEEHENSGTIRKLV